MNWLNSFDQWMVNTAHYPGTFGIIMGLMIGTFFIPETLMFIRQHLMLIEKKGQPASALPQMTVHEIAEYLCTKSVWADSTYCRLNFMEFVKNAVPGEMANAGKEGSVRFLGAPPNNTCQLEEIVRTYWVMMTIDSNRIWDNRNRVFTVRSGYAPTGLAVYEYGTAPRIDVERKWPEASVFRKVWSNCYVASKKKWFSIKACFRKNRHL